MIEYEFALEKDDIENGTSEFLLFTKNKSEVFELMNKQTEPAHYIVYKIEEGKRKVEDIFLSKVLKMKEVKKCLNM